MLLFYNKSLIDHTKISVRVIIGLLRMFTLGITDSPIYGKSGDIIDKILVDLRDEKTSFTEPPRSPLVLPTLANILSDRNYNPNYMTINMIQQIKDIALEVITSRKQDRLIPRDIYKVIVDESQPSFGYIKSFYKDIEGQLTPYQKHILTSYTTSSMTLNKKLRSDNPNEKFNISEKCMFNVLLRTFQRRAKRVDRPIIAYRGIKGLNIDINYLRDLYQNGFVNFQFTSVSISPVVAYNFVKGHDCCVLKLYLYNVMAIYMEDIVDERFKNEYELILPPGIVIYRIGESVQSVLEDGIDTGKKIHIMECLVTQLNDNAYNNMIETVLPRVKTNLLLTERETQERCEDPFLSQQLRRSSASASASAPKGKKK
jgi:hypothetical protein